MLADTDPSLSQKDIQTAFRVNEAFRELFEHIHKCEGRVKRRQPASFCIDAFVTSPLTVSLQTASISTVAMGKEMACKDPKQTLEEKSRVTWLIDPMLREQLSGPSETGTELNELLTRLNELYDNVQMARTAIDIATMAAGETWWSPYTKDELETILHRNRLVAPGQILADEDSATGEEAAAAEETEAGEAASAAADADQSTVVKIGDPEVMPLTASARALRDTIKTVERPLHNRNDEGASAERPVRESDDLVELRGKVILHVLCKTEALTTVLLVSHKKLLEKMLRKRISPAKLKFAILSCGVEPSLAVLSSKTPVSSIQQSLGDLSQLPAQEE
ncbi:hypothetical protein, conserved [Eimeria tenella]|uniref:Uncharacterized protein n=1 Tax=Eimeria tenella TaxID=5802 RepID=U6KYZ2_EIMTE|nr:hypothetical protein, conserved [Eimeria tenella]CDJ41529.1 hypothetical protein, conserved [Eimeria tenella]|eukprot:XP_013232279.1 hypothetical protein, conserved [Eimeria tenella]